MPDAYLQEIIRRLRDIPHHRDMYDEDKVHLMSAIAHLSAIQSEYLHPKESVRDAIDKVSNVSEKKLRKNLKEFFGI